MTVRNAIFELPPDPDDNTPRYLRYVEVLRHPVGAGAKIWDWIKKRAYYQKKYKDDDADKEFYEIEAYDEDEGKHIRINSQSIG